MYKYTTMILQGEKERLDNFIKRIQSDKVRTFIKSEYQSTIGDCIYDLVVRTEVSDDELD